MERNIERKSSSVPRAMAATATALVQDFPGDVRRSSLYTARHGKVHGHGQRTVRGSHLHSVSHSNGWRGPFPYCGDAAPSRRPSSAAVPSSCKVPKVSYPWYRPKMTLTDGSQLQLSPSPSRPGADLGQVHGHARNATADGKYLEDKRQERTLTTHLTFALELLHSTLDHPPKREPDPRPRLTSTR